MERVDWLLSKWLIRRRKVFTLSAFSLYLHRPLTPRTANFSFSFTNNSSFISFTMPSLWHPTLTFINPQAPQVQSQAPKSWQKYQLIKMSHFPCPKKNLLTADKPKKPKTNQHQHQQQQQRERNQL